MSNIFMYDNRVFPLMFKAYLKEPGTKKAWFSDNKSQNPEHCKNCGGDGTITLTIGTAGPFINNPSGIGVIAHFDKDIDKWWSVKSYEEPCPCCNGNGIDPDFNRGPLKYHATDLSGVLKSTKPVEVDDYTDY